MNNAPLPDQWSSKWAFILAATGAAVGLGNIWRFPYLLGSHGGSAFFLMYLVCLIVLGLPALMAEILIGRQARTNPVDALASLATQHQHSKHWRLLGWWGALALIIILSFYSVVSGWSIAYLWHSIAVGFPLAQSLHTQQLWQNFMQKPWQLLLWHTVFMSLTIGVIILGVEKGLERATKIMMPALYIILLILVIYAMHIGNFKHTLHYLFDFKISAITPSTVLAALGQAFFTLALGAGAMLTYGAYAPQKTSLPFAVAVVAILDVLVAILAGLAIFPLVFAFHLSPSSGPNLMYITLPMAFSHMAWGGLVGALFFISLLFAAWTSSINLAEPLVVILMQKYQFSRSRAAWLVGAIAWLLGILSLLSFGPWQHVLVFGRTFFQLATDIPTNIILPLGALGFAFFAGWILPKHVTQAQVNSKLYRYWLFLVRYIVPLAIVAILLDSWI